jgi:peptidyl-prolyl cis-trans isomerase D
MALIKKIREKTGLAVGLVAMGLMFFIVGGDILGPNSVILGTNKNEVGEIAGEDIALEEYQQQVEEMKYNYTLNVGRNPTESEMYSIRQQAWDFMIVKIAFQKQFDELGITVTDEELVDMVQGRNVHPEIRMAFSDSTGNFNREQVVAYLQNIARMPQQQQAQWYLFEKNLKPSRLRIKYDNLMLKANYITTAEARQAYQAENTIAEVKYLYVPYYAVNDSLVEVTDADLKNYLEKNRGLYESEESRSMEYVTFSMVPSAEDTAYFRDELNQLRESFRQAENDSAFARTNSDAANSYRKIQPGQLPSPLLSNLSNLSEGDVRGPYLVNGNLTLYKISEIAEDTVQSAKASHILFRADDTDPAAKEEARKEAQRVLNEIKGGADFAEMAQQYSDDPSSARGGDLGWFSEGRMVEPFENAVFSRNSAGLIDRLIETEYGYHIINVTEPKTNQAFYLASVERELTPSDDTRNEAYRKADYFAATTGNLEEFEANAQRDSVEVQTAANVTPNDRSAGSLGDAREVIRWLYNEGSAGKVSQVFELDDQYVVAVMTDKKEKGDVSLEDVREEIAQQVRNEKKAAYIKNKLQEINGTLEEMATTYGQDARVYNTSDLKLSSNTLPSVGVAPKAVGRAFSLEQGARSEPVESPNGIVVIELEAITQAPEASEFASFKDQLDQQYENRASYFIGQLVRDFSDIKDMRYRFY